MRPLMAIRCTEGIRQGFVYNESPILRIYAPEGMDCFSRHSIQSAISGLRHARRCGMPPGFSGSGFFCCGAADASSARRMKRPGRSSPACLRLRVLCCFVLVCTCRLGLLAQESTDIESPKHKAWDMLTTAALSKHTDDRVDGIRALGLLRDNARAREFAENALNDPKSEVRAAAATALGQMHAREAVPKLEKALADPKVP